MTPPSDFPTGIWGEFPNTVLHFSAAESCNVDLREPVTSVHQARFTSMGLERTFGIVSAQDPNGQPLSPAENRVLATKLQGELIAARTPYVPLEACSPDQTHCEASLAISLSQDDVVALAIRYNQLAIFWFDGTRFWIVPAVASTPAIPLPVRGARLCGGDNM